MGTGSTGGSPDLLVPLNCLQPESKYDQQLMEEKGENATWHVEDRLLAWQPAAFLSARIERAGQQ